MSKTQASKASLSEKFQKDKKATIQQAQEYLRKNPQAPKCSESLNKEAVKFLKQGNFTKALQALERSYDARSGIVSQEIEIKDAAPVLIRDARNCLVPAQRGAEAFVMQYINMIRAAIEIAEIEKKDYLKTYLQKKAESFAGYLDSNFSQKKLADILNKNFSDLVSFLEDNEIYDAQKKLNFAKDFQNFNDPHHNIVTISELEDGKGGSFNVIEAEVAFRGLTEEQESDLQLLKKDKRLSKMQRQLIERHEKEILDGNHIIPTQTKTSLPGIKAFEKIVMVGNEEVLSSKHGGALASLIPDKKLQKIVTNHNIAQAQIFAGDGAKLHSNMLNRKAPEGKNYDSRIVELVTESNGVEFTTTTSANLFRKLGSANDFSGVKRFLGDLADSINIENFSPDDRKTLIAIKKHIKGSSGFFEMSSNKALKKLSSINLGGNSQMKDVIKDAIELAKDVKKADVSFKIFDGENIGLKVASSLNRIAGLVSKLRQEKNLPGVDIPRLPNDCIMTSCTHGKDRTGIKLHLESALAVAKKLDVNLDYVDQRMVAASSSGHMAGSVYAGFATVGCFGIKSENRFVFPGSRKKELMGMIEASASTNKVSEASWIDQLKNIFSVRKSDHKVAISSAVVTESENSQTQKSAASNQNLITLTSSASLKNPHQVHYR